MRRLGCLVLIAGLCIAAFLTLNFVRGWMGDGPAEKDTTVIISEGMTLTRGARDMEKAGVISSSQAFLSRAKIFASDAPIKAGEYLIPAHASNRDILNLLQSGKVVARLVTIPEGMPSILVHEKLLSEKYLTGDVAVPREGSVLPDSYSYERGERRQAVLDRMQKAMKNTLDELWRARAKDAVVKTPEEALTLASIVEKETGVPSERRTVAGVYNNRLKIGMRLQADPTIIYPITQGKPLGRRIKRSEIEAVNGYNTYAMAGLPKGPIANPGRASIEAVLHPAKTKALYFVADGKGGHIFSDTLEEHQANVKKWFAIRRARGEL
ncbi:endolytic transglycosylase MltG [Rhizorhapis sp. SPR117]|uniref:endolytic transglycosylase MltG n=1 Tax=Rhizorhapis sp. SPR117 TaxID=2912611 RepID=UPI001F009567|nr:endolytic transglycosylase MltG [Rhizorhapis sp. SPR117]